MIDAQTLERLTGNEADMAVKKRVRTIFEWIEPSDDKVVLDCACGRGFDLNMIRAVSGCKLVGLELDDDVIRKAYRNVGKFPDVFLTQANIYQQPYPDNYFDGVILSEILEHIEDDVRGLREVYPMLKPSVVVPITVPNVNYPFSSDPINQTLESSF